jgi:hypothetical protein
MSEPIIEKNGEMNLINGLKVRHAAEIKILQEKYAAMELTHAREIQILETDYQAKIRSLTLSLTRAKTFLIMVFILALFLGCILFINSVKNAPVEGPVPTQVPNTGTTVTQALVSPPAPAPSTAKGQEKEIPTPSATAASTAKPTGNGGNFVGGNSGK